MRILIHLDGGLVQNVYTDQPNVDVMVLNFDTDGNIDDYVATLSGHAACDRFPAEIAPEHVQKEFTLSDARIILKELAAARVDTP